MTVRMHMLENALAYMRENIHARGNVQRDTLFCKPVFVVAAHIRSNLNIPYTGIRFNGWTTRRFECRRAAIEYVGGYGQAFGMGKLSEVCGCSCVCERWLEASNQ